MSEGHASCQGMALRRLLREVRGEGSVYVCGFLAVLWRGKVRPVTRSVCLGALAVVGSALVLGSQSDRDLLRAMGVKVSEGRAQIR